MKVSYRWPFKALFLSISLSIVFSLLSQSLQPRLSVFFSVFIIVFFIFLSVISDMISSAFTSVKKKELETFKGKRGYDIALKLCDNCDKVASFSGDVIGDICSILSGAGGVSFVLNLHIENATIYLLSTCLASSLIAGLTIFFKAIMKNYAITNCAKLALWTGAIFDFRFHIRKNKTKSENNKNIEK